MTIRIFYSTISIYYKPFAGLAPWVVKSTRPPKLIFAIHSIECGIFCRLYQDLPRSGFKTPSWAQWLRCDPPVNSHIPMYAENNAFPDRADALMHTLMC